MFLIKPDRSYRTEPYTFQSSYSSSSYFIPSVFGDIVPCEYEKPEAPLKISSLEYHQAFRRLKTDSFFGRMVEDRLETPFRREWKLVSEGTRSIDLLAVSICDYVLKDLAFDQICATLNQAVFIGKAGVYIQWEERRIPIFLRDKNGEKTKLTSRVCTVPVSDLCFPIEPEILRFSKSIQSPENQSYRGHELRLLETYRTQGVPVPKRTILVHTYGNTANINGEGILGRLVNMPIIKEKTIKILLPSLEARDVPIAKYGEGVTEEEILATRHILSNFWETGFIDVNSNVELDFLARFHNARIEQIQNFLDWLDTQMSVSIIGSSLGSKVDTQIQRGNTQVHYQVGQNREKTDCDRLSESLHTLLKWIVELNVPGAIVPRVYRVFDDETEGSEERDPESKPKKKNSGSKPEKDESQPEEQE